MFAVAAAQVALVNDGVEGPSGLDVSLELREGLPWLQIETQRDLTVHWSEARLLAPDGKRGSFILSKMPDFGPLPTTNYPEGGLRAGESYRWFITPTHWLDETRAQQEELLTLWSATHFSEVELPVEIDGVVSVHRTLWRTEPVAVPVKVSSLPPVVDTQARNRWDLQYRRHRSAERSAKSVWWMGLTGGVVGTAFSLAFVSEAVRREDEEIARRARQNALLFGAVGAVGFTLTVPAHFWERASRRRIKELGLRPR